MMARDVREGGTAILDEPADESIAPNSVEEVVSAFRERARRGGAIAIVGGATEIGFGYPPERIATLVRTERMTRVVEYAPADMVVTVEAGITLDALQTVLAQEGQRLALDAPRSGFATIGGLLATNAFGPRRARYGTLRDLIVGISLVRADGTLVRGGGKVVKNVAGFDVPKVMVGSLGTLGLIGTATFRLHPKPEREQWYAIPGRSVADVRALARGLLERRLEAAAVVALAAEDAYDAYVLFEGFGAGVESQGSRLREFCAAEFEVDARRIESQTDVDVARLDEDARTFGSVRLRLSVPPSALPEIEREAIRPLRKAFTTSKCSLYPLTGHAFLGGYPFDANAFERAFTISRILAERAGGNLVVLDCEERGLRDRIDPFGTLPPSFPIMRRLKERFDPERRLNPGRFLGRL
ncbi:MAG: FAD-binding oxidoreductase [Candidatus Eremiobacteraeota bacterium]|nr:FAD-binding oxidoreductase [Candidatus Eremiobacteraeota bacterium]